MLMGSQAIVVDRDHHERQCNDNSDGNIRKPLAVKEM
jgi:hypothetical protein